ncbi:hypothetical protein LXL04_027783 [Taraxacum kok-saghyz]
MKSLQITKELLQDIAQSRNVKSGYKQITQISSLCHRFIMARTPSSNQEPYIDTIKSKPTQLQYPGLNQVPMPASPNNWNEQQQMKPLHHYDTSMPFWTSKAQVCISKSSKDNHWGDHWPEVKRQNREARRLLLDLEKLCNDVGRFPGCMEGWGGICFNSV